MCVRVRVFPGWTHPPTSDKSIRSHFGSITWPEARAVGAMPTWLTLDADLATLLTRNGVNVTIKSHLMSLGCTSLATFANRAVTHDELKAAFFDATPHQEDAQQLSRLTVAWRQSEAIVADTLQRPEDATPAHILCWTRLVRTPPHIFRWTRLVRVALRLAFHWKLWDVQREWFEEIKRRGRLE